MFIIKSNEKIGSHLKKLILIKYKSVRQFCLDYLNLSQPANSDDPQEIRNLTNRFSQILSGNKAIQTYDLPIISELLGVSCEDVLSCGEYRVPLKNRRTNYNVAFSTDKKDWQEHLLHKDCIAAYADEFGKTVVDYAIEFKNYKFIKYLIENNYITFISDDPNYYPNPYFGAKSNIAEKPYERITLDDEFANNKLLRTQVLALAIENGDTDTLMRFGARELPPQINIRIWNPQFSVSEYYDESYLDEIAKSSSNIFDFFLEEYPLMDFTKKHEIMWIYPFIGELAIRCIELNEQDRVAKTLDVILAHNNKAYKRLHDNLLQAAKIVKDSFGGSSYHDVLNSMAREYEINNEKNLVAFHPFYIRDINPSAYNIIRVNYKCKDEAINEKINKINHLYDDILTLPTDLIKDH